MKQRQMSRGIYSGGNTNERHPDYCPSCGFNPVVFDGEHHVHCWFVLNGELEEYLSRKNLT